MKATCMNCPNCERCHGLDGTTETREQRDEMKSGVPAHMESDRSPFSVPPSSTHRNSAQNVHPGARNVKALQQHANDIAFVLPSRYVDPRRERKRRHGAARGPKHPTP